MKSSLFFLLVLLSFFIAGVSCQKGQKLVPQKDGTTAKDKNNLNTENVNLMACMYGQVGIYASGNGLFDTAYVDEFVSNGVARLGNSPYSSPFWTGLHIWQHPNPYCAILGDAIGDSLTFSVRLKNPSSGIGSVSAYDVGLQIVGTQNTAGVSFVGNTANQQYTYLKVGNSVYANSPIFVRVFNNWTVLTLTATSVPPNYSLTVYQDGVWITTILYPVSGGIGQVKDFVVAFKGSGSVDWMRVSSSNTGTVVLRNEFEDVSFWDGLEFF